MYVLVNYDRREGAKCAWPVQLVGTIIYATPAGDVISLNHPYTSPTFLLFITSCATRIIRVAAVSILRPLYPMQPTIFLFLRN
jgi:hypothetical protein